MGNWRMILESGLKEGNPTLYQQLLTDRQLEAWLTLRVEMAVARYEQLIREAMRPDRAREVATAEMLEGLDQ
jgi:hypothetical protein